jgi:lantibiotic biosynthesis protein
MTIAATTATADAMSDRIARDLADPQDTLRRHDPRPWWRQALAGGALGVALLHVERARAGIGPWSHAEAWLRYTASGPIDDGPGSHLHYGAPALAYVLHHAAADHPGRYACALTILDARIGAVTTTRVDAAHRRIDTGHPPPLCEFDAIRGLTGLGAYWLHRDPARPELHCILEYLVRLTEPLPAGADPLARALPGWWTHLATDGRRSAAFPHGHANHGLSHGIAGPLALLALAARAGHTVPHHHAAIGRILHWLDRWQRADADGRTWWPYWTTTPDPDHPDARQLRDGRPSWCYGTPGIARAQQLAGLALGDTTRARDAETALLNATAAPDLAGRLDNLGLCHGLAGALLIIRRAAADSPNHHLHDHVADLQQLLTRGLADGLGAAAGRFGLLDGAGGIALSLADTGPGWDACLLTS